jgi:hypothetical protein
MAATVYSTRFIAAVFPTAPSTYVVPDGYRAVVRDISAYWLGDSGGGALQGAIDGVAYFMYFIGTADVPGGYHWEGRVVVDPGEALAINVPMGNWSFVVSGYLLKLP